MDFDMPKMDGLQTLEKMYQIDNDVRCFIVSGTEFKKSEISKATHVFLKPWLSDLWIEAAKVMGKKKK
jgi:YesN/AraC family two-component response regulator